MADSELGPLVGSQLVASNSLENVMLTDDERPFATPTPSPKLNMSLEKWVQTKNYSTSEEM